ncbi:MAG: hypothetical protein QM602_12320, partial [Microbacterium sp.]
EFLELAERIRCRPHPVALASCDLGDDTGIRQPIDRGVGGGRGLRSGVRDPLEHHRGLRRRSRCFPTTSC